MYCRFLHIEIAGLKDKSIKPPRGIEKTEQVVGNAHYPILVSVHDPSRSIIDLTVARNGLAIAVQ